MSATQLMPASGPPANASRFPARIRPSPAMGDRNRPATVQSADPGRLCSGGGWGGLD